jgi:hypothetical protein
MANFDNVAEVVEDYAPLQVPPNSRWRRYATWDQGFELLCVVIMALASLTAAWSGYQASSWSGSASVDQTRASDVRLDANRAEMDADVQVMQDMSMFDYWTTAYIANDTTMAHFYRARFSPELERAMNAWLATDPFNSPGSAASPFDLDIYTPVEIDHANELTAEAEALFDQSLDKLDASDHYVLNTVILATVVFFAGLAAKLNWVPARLTAIALSVALLLWSAWEILRQPVNF